MRGTTRLWPVNPLLAGIVVVITLTVGVVVYQVNQGDDIPGSAGGYDQPRDRGGQATGDTIAAWASAAAVGDYATVQDYMNDGDVRYGMWQAQHSSFQKLIVGYHIVSQETAGQTTTAIVRFDLSRGTPACITLLVDERIQRIEVNQVYGACPGQR